MTFKTMLPGKFLILPFVALLLALGLHGAAADDLFTVRGELAWGENVELPADSVAVVQITDPDAIEGTPMLAEQRLPLKKRGGPLPFAIQTDRDGFKDGRNYVLRATILDGSTPTWTAGDIAISPAKGGMDVGTVEMQPYKAPPATDGNAAQGDAVRPQDLQGIEWVIEDINGDMVLDDSTVTITFGVDGKLSGKASCNGYHAGYTLKGDMISVTAVAATKMACAPELMHQEQSFLDILANAASLYLDDDGALVIQSSGDRTLTARSE